jgi:hypothetical protein
VEAGLSAFGGIPVGAVPGFPFSTGLDAVSLMAPRLMLEERLFQHLQPWLRQGSARKVQILGLVEGGDGILSSRSLLR